MPSGTALVARAILVVWLPVFAGCSGSESGSTGVEPLPTGPPPSSAPTSGGPASARPPAGPRLVFPADVHLVFDYADTADPAKDGVLHDWEAGQRVFNAAETLANPTFRLLARYQAGNALAAAVRTLRTKRQRRETVVGTRRFYQVNLGEMATAQARVTWCVDDSQFFARAVATGKPVVHHGPGDYYRVRGTLQHDPASKIWVLVDVVSEVGVRC
jgi:hypothetical protein